jgi:hypothetical protein
MADPAYVQSLLGPLPVEQRSVWRRVWEYVLGNLHFGPVAHQTRLTNFQAYYLAGTTPAAANEEFTIAHGLGRAPYVLLPALALDAIGGQMVPLKVTRAADASRVYLSSPTTSAAIWIVVE